MRPNTSMSVRSSASAGKPSQMGWRWATSTDHRDDLAGWALAIKCLRNLFKIQGRMGMWMYLIDLECAWFQGPKIGTSLVLFGYLAAKHPGKEPKRRGFANGHGLNGKYVYRWIWWYFEVWIQNSWDIWGVSHSEVRTLECKPVFSCIEWNVVFAVLMLQIISFWYKDRLAFVRVDCEFSCGLFCVFFFEARPYAIYDISEYFRAISGGGSPTLHFHFPQIRVTRIILTIHGSWTSRARLRGRHKLRLNYHV